MGPIMTPAAALEQILQSPAMPRMLTELTRAYIREQAARRRILDEVTEDGKHEFINGEHVVQGPVKLEHTVVSQNIFELLKRYSRRHAPGSFVGIEKIMVHLTRNDYEPDVCWFGPDKAATFSADTMLFPAPDLVVEVLSPSTEKNDRGVKWEDYAAHGLAEYWITDPDSRILE
jgi:Uma2 family endonuclease